MPGSIDMIADVLQRVMGVALRAVGEAAADGDDLHVGAVVADVVADLLEAAQRREIGDRIGEDVLPAQRHAGGDARSCSARRRRR